MSDPSAPAKSVDDRLAALERQTEWLVVELEHLRSVLVSMVTVGNDGLLSES